MSKVSAPSSEVLIEIRIERVTQLFNTFDPLPFRERDLDKDAEEFIVGCARELPKLHPIRIVVHLPPAEASTVNSDDLNIALSRYFSNRSEMIHRELKELFRIGRRSLVVGIAVLAVCLIAGGWLAGLLRNDIGQFLQEGLAILGWVANWRPIEIFLFDWWAVEKRRTLMSRLAHAKIEIRSDKPLNPGIATT